MAHEPVITPSLTDFICRPATSVGPINENHTVPTDLEYDLDKEVDPLHTPACAGLTVITSGAPADGEVLITLNNHITHHVNQLGGTYQWTYWRYGTMNNETMLNQTHTPLEDAFGAAMKFHVTLSSGTLLDIQPGNCFDGTTPIAVAAVETFDVDAATPLITNGKWTQILLYVYDAGGSVGAYGATYSLPEQANKAATTVPDPPHVGMPIARIYYHKGSAIDAANIESFDGREWGGGGDITGQCDWGQDGTLLRGDSVCHSQSVASRAEQSDADDDTKMPAFGIVSQVIDTDYVQVQTSGLYEFVAGNTNFGTFGGGDIGEPVYVDTTAGQLTLTRNQIPDEWDQSMGIVVAANKIDIIVGTATKNVQIPIPPPPDGPEPPIPPPPDGSKMKRGAGVSEGDFVYTDTDLETAKLAKADAATTMPSIGIVDEEIDATWCIVKNNYLWKIAEHGDMTPGNLTPGAFKDTFYISQTTAGEATRPVSVNPEWYIQVACRQMLADGTVFFICCGPATKPAPEDPDDGYDYDCANDVAVGHSVYLDANGVARKTDATDDAKYKAKGIVKAVNVANNRCTIVCEPNIYDPTGTYTAGEYQLDPDTPGGYLHHSTILWKPGDWKVRIGFGRGLIDPTTGGIQVSILVYGKFKDPGDDDGGDDDPGNDRIIGMYRGHFNINVDSFVHAHSIDAGYVELSTYSNSAEMKGVVLSTEHDPGPDEYIIFVLERGLHGVGYTPGQPYFQGPNPGVIIPGLTFGTYEKCAGVGRADGQLYVNPQPSKWIDQASGDPVPVTDYVSKLDPVPIANPYDKIRGNDGTTAAVKVSGNWDGKDQEFLIEVPTVIQSGVDFFAKSTGAGAGAFLECDLCRGSDDVSVLLTKAKLVTTGDGVRGDTLPTSANNLGHTRAVVDEAKMPVDPGETLYWLFTVNGIHTTDPYGIGIILNKYGVKG